MIDQEEKLISISADNSHFHMTDPNVQVKQQNYCSRDGLIHNIYFGDQTGVTVKKAGAELTILARKIRSNSREVLILTDITGLGDVNLAARKMILRTLQELDYDRWAIFGCNFISAGLVKLMIIASGRGFKIRVFDNQKEAKSWLKS